MSYAIFLYADGLIQWTTSDYNGGINGLGGIEASIGVTAGDGENFIDHEYSFTPEVLSITTSRVPDTVTVGGMLMYRVDGSDDPHGKWKLSILCNWRQGPSLIISRNLYNLMSPISKSLPNNACILTIFSYIILFLDSNFM